MESKTLRHIITVVWGMIFCMNLSICLLTPDPHPISWILVGFALGGVFFTLIDNSIINLQDNFVKILLKHNKDILKFSKEVTEVNDELLKELKNKKVKGGKKKNGVK